MGIFKGLNRSDVFVTDYVSQKHWVVRRSELGDFGVTHTKVYSGSVVFDSSLYQNYYSGSREDGSFTGSANLNLQTTITIPGSRQLPDRPYGIETTASVAMFMFSSDLIGIGIEENSISIIPKEDAVLYVEEGYVEEDNTLKDPFYFEDLRLYPTVDTNGVLLSQGYNGSYEMQEDFEYPRPIKVEGSVVGDVIYNQGVIVVTDPFWAYIYNLSGKGSEGQLDAFVEMRWKSNVPIYTYNVGCTVQDHEFNYTHNRTAKHLVGNRGFTPYITSVGLYNSRNELVAVAKLSKPIRKVDNIDMTINIRIDIS